MNKKREYKVVTGYIEGKVRYTTINGEPFYVARDLELLLGRKGFSNGTRVHCRGELVYRTFFNYGCGKAVNLRVINVGEVMRLIAKCNTPKAKELADYLFQVIMPVGLKHHSLPFETIKGNVSSTITFALDQKTKVRREEAQVA